MYNNFFYKSVPVFIQNIYVSLIALIKMKMRATKETHQLTESLIANESNKEDLNEYHQKLLQEALLNAKKNIPFYFEQDQALNELDDFNFLSKEEVRTCSNQLVNINTSEKKFKGQTSGTTGTPLTIYQNIYSIRMERAFADRQRIWAGYKDEDKRAWIRGDMIVPFDQKEGPFWRYSIFENMIMLSSFHMTNEALPLYLKAMVDYGVNIIQAYPSSILALAKYLDIHDDYYQGNLKSILTSSESLSREDKLLIEKRFKCTVFDWYGLFERVAAIASCEHGNYHLLTDYSHVELINQGDGYHEIVGTNFNNSLFPLIRYKTGDFVALSTKDKCPCGRAFPMIDHIKGRIGDYLVAEGGQKIHILNHIPKGVEGLIATQFTQNSYEEIKVLVVVESSLFSAAQESQLIKNVQDRLGKSIKVSIEIVDSIPKTKNGKSRQAICTIKEG
jgi:phenylacetate-CoA ligase